MTETPQGHVHDYDEDGDCVRCGRDLFAGGEDGATPEAAATAVTPGQAAYKAWQARRTGIPDGDWHWDLLVANENAREAWEDAGRAAIEAARLRQPEELRQAMAETRQLREKLAAMTARWKGQAAMHDRDADRTGNDREAAALSAKSRVYTGNADEVLEMIGGQA
jgi:hypothetical protein